MIDPVTDFFVISVMYLNECTCENDLYGSGVAPITSKSTNYTLVLKHYYLLSADELDHIITSIFLGKTKMYLTGGIFSKRKNIF